jgi:cytochrome P450
MSDTRVEDEDTARNSSDSNKGKALPPAKKTKEEFLVPALRHVQHLPVLNAVITETLRVHPIVPAMLSRVAPSASSVEGGGGTSSSSKATNYRGGGEGDGVPVAGVWVPANTRVSVPAYTLQRAADVFPAPDEWRPARWFVYNDNPDGVKCDRDGDGGGGGLETKWDDDAGSAVGEGARGRHPASADGSDAMRAHMLAFSRGPRVCLGRAIALAELRVAVAAVARHFGSVRLAEPVRQTEADMQMRDHFALIPRGHRCLLVLE